MTKARLSALTVMAAAVVGCSSAEGGGNAGPNFVMIFIDDMGYGDIGPFGATKQKTPNLDRMAREGVRMTSFYAAPVCSVSRAQLMTGCYGARISVPGVYPPGNKSGLNPDEHTIAERLKERGYATACIGKWHLGDQPVFLPTRQGFDRYLGIPYSNDMQKKSTETGEKVVPLVRDEKVIELLTEEAQGRIEERYTEEAIDFIRANRGRPFFLYLPHTAVHTPIHPGAAFAGKSANGRFGDWVEEVDWSTGRILDTLRELNLDKGTLVMFSSDNGPWLIKGADGGSAGPLRGGKGSTWEGGVRVPTVVWWPGRIPAGTTCDAVAGTIDVLPTFVALAGGQVPPEPTIDGRDISALFFGGTRESPREAHYYFAGYNLQAVRQGPWKLAIAPQPETMGKKTAADAAGKEPRLYNLDVEIGERTNVADKHPEIVARLQKLIETMGAEIGGKNPRARRPAGEVADPRTLYASEGDHVRRKSGKGELGVGDLSSLKAGDTLAAGSAPQVGNVPFEISCTVDSKQRDAVLIAHGGTAVGYALHIRGGRIAFAVRAGGGDAVAEVIAPESVEGPVRVAVALAADGAMTLRLNGKVVASGRSAGLIRRQPQEDFCVGHDGGKPLTQYSGRRPFEGTISDIEIRTKP
ncbi:MAG TPA: sulfatase [Verrucomicrobiae bacterium]|nr:sulfatase [Verrucomicrobiae bacterium]